MTLVNAVCDMDLLWNGEEKLHYKCAGLKDDVRFTKTESLIFNASLTFKAYWLRDAPTV